MRLFPRWSGWFFRRRLGKIGELLKSNIYSVEQAVSYFRRTFIHGRLNVFWNNTNFSTEAHVPFSSPEPVVSWPVVGYKLSRVALGTRMHTYQLRGMASTLRMRTTISPVEWQPGTAVLPLLGLIRVMVLRMCKVLAIPQSRSQSPRVTLVQRNNKLTVNINTQQ